MDDAPFTRHDEILAGLAISLQAAAMQQLGKIKHPATGRVERDLEQARATIDMVEMLKVKCRTDTPASLLRLLDTAVMELQMNYLEELKRDREQERAGDQQAGEQQATAEQPAAAAAPPDRQADEATGPAADPEAGPEAGSTAGEA